MDDISVKFLLMPVGVIILSLVMSVVSWSVVLGTQIMGNAQDKLAASYSAVDESVLRELNRNKEIDSLNLYRIINVNSDSLNDYSVTRTDNSPVTDMQELLDNPNDIYDVVVTGSNNAGFELKAKRRAP